MSLLPPFLTGFTAGTVIVERMRFEKRMVFTLLAIVLLAAFLYSEYSASEASLFRMSFGLEENSQGGLLPSRIQNQALPLIPFLHLADHVYLVQILATGSVQLQLRFIERTIIFFVLFLMAVQFLIYQFKIFLGGNVLLNSSRRHILQFLHHQDGQK